MPIKRTTSKTGLIITSIMFGGSPTEATATWMRFTVCAIFIAPTLQSFLWMTPRGVGLQPECVPTPMRHSPSCIMPAPPGVQIRQVGALLILPVSLALRFAMPHLTGWHHVWATALLTIVATFLVAILLANQALR